MARKNLLADLVTGQSDKLPAPPVRRPTGAVGAVGRSIADLKANAVIEIPADMIDAAGIEDRLGEDEDQARLVASIREYGQQVPVLVRHSPNYEGRYEVVYGRRRVAAVRTLGGKVRAMVRDLPDRDLIVAQGQENAARKDLTFIEKVNFARRMRDLRFDRKVICDALHIDKTQISRMLTVADAVPDLLMRAIGPAPGIGRDRWVAFARALPGREDAALTAVEDVGTSDARFEAAWAATRLPRRREPEPEHERVGWVTVRRTGRATSMTFPRGEDPFADWLAGRLDDLRAEWAQSAPELNRKE